MDLTNAETDAPWEGERLKARRIRLGFKSVNDLSIRSGIDRQAITKAERGKGFRGTIDRLEAFFDRYEKASRNDRFITLQVEVTVRVPVENADVLQALASDLSPLLARLEALQHHRKKETE